MSVEAVNRNELRIIGMSRSGNHALIQWILGQLHGRYCFLNCCEGKSNPFATARPMDDGRRCLTNLQAFDLEREQAGEHQPKDWLLFSHEDNYLRNACSRELEREHDRWLGPSQRRVDVLLLRDPFNLFASRLRQDHARIGDKVAVQMWKQHARQFLDGAKQLRHAPVLVRYNRWVADAAYRRELADALGLEFCDAAIGRVPSCAGGSSFDGLKYDGRAARMDVFGRWRHFVADARYRRCFDSQVLAMSRAIFGAMPEAEAALTPRALAAAE